MQTTLHIFQAKNIPKEPFSQTAKPTLYASAFTSVDHFLLVYVFFRGIIPLQSVSSLSCDHGLHELVVDSRRCCCSVTVAPAAVVIESADLILSLEKASLNSSLQHNISLYRIIFSGRPNSLEHHTQDKTSLTRLLRRRHELLVVEERCC